MAPQNTAPDVVVVGAGLAGLACASDLLSAGLRVRLVEASDGVGGRMRSDRCEGFTLDRGFQVFNTAYPQVRRRFELRTLRLHPFTPGVLLHTAEGPLRFVDPSRRPRASADLRPGRLAGARDLVALGAMTARDMLAPARLLRRGDDRSTRTALAAAGLSEEFVERFFRPFLSGVFLEDELETSSRVFHLVWRSMLRGSLCLPARGIGAVPEQLADRLPRRVLALGTPVERLTDDGVLLASGRELAAPAVVVATGPGAAAALLPGLGVPPYRVTTTYYHAAGVSPLREATLLVDERRRFLTSCVLTEVVRGYAPAGSVLISTSVAGKDAPGREGAVRAALADAYGTDTSAWQLLRAANVAEALPAMPAPHPLSRTTRFGPGRFVCGDHRATGSVQGALASGARAAREVLAAARA